MTPGEAGSAPLTAFERLRLRFAQNEREVAAAFFAGGFLFDIVTVGRIDSWLTIGQQLLYLSAVMAVLLHMFVAQGAPPVELAGQPRLWHWYYEYRSAAIHFALGALLNLYAIFFFKSSSLLVSFGFLGFLVTIVVANESRRFKALGLHVKFALLALCWLSFAAIVVPIAVGAIGQAVFVSSMVVGALPIAGAVEWVRRRRPAQFAAARRQILLPAGAVLALFLGAYLLRAIPPAPLSIPFIGVYHSVERIDAGYILGHERPWWRFWHHGDQYFRAQPGDRVFVYFRVFSPARFADQVKMRWYWEPGGRGWLLQDSIPIRIVGGRAEGFRGYGFKANYQPGRWKVEVESDDEREIGRVYFTLESVAEESRTMQVELE
ncbi:MAG: DUF2914 domain-containing protein [Betaproteobacteria bacterium]|nr:DUF2914 domain-containing protein [Betaproteobacteria bacterium]MDH5211699.1 DUF2914 domain-containing protein [Betaproteobacteria bacterium]